MWDLDSAKDHFLHPDGPAAQQGVALYRGTQQRTLLLLTNENTGKSVTFIDCQKSPRGVVPV